MREATLYFPAITQPGAITRADEDSTLQLGCRQRRRVLAARLARWPTLHVTAMRAEAVRSSLQRVDRSRAG
jgi:hypothetical protein